MPKLWLAGASQASLQATLDLQDASPPGFRWLNEAAAHTEETRIAAEYGAHSTAEVEPLAFRAMPTPAFEITDPGFRFDFFECSIVFASRRLRSAMDLPAGTVEYREIDADRCTAAAQAMRYAAMQLLAFADPFDHDRTSGGSDHVMDADRRTTDGWRPARPVPGRTSTIFWRDGFLPPAPLFRVPGTAWTLATEELAARVMDDGLTDLVFQDVQGEKAAGDLRYRQR